MVKESLYVGFIQPNVSSSSAPILVFRKKDGLWRLCMDFKELNYIIIKDNFLISSFDDLLEYLNRVKFFSKLDLQSRYHQIRMSKKDIFKTIFRIHEGLYVFLVILFGLINAPSTFKSLMNQASKSCLWGLCWCSFMIVWFVVNLGRIIWSHRISIAIALGKSTLCQEVQVCFWSSRNGIFGAQFLRKKYALASERSHDELVNTKNSSLGSLGLTRYYCNFVKDYGKQLYLS